MELSFWVETTDFLKYFRKYKVAPKNINYCSQFLESVTFDNCVIIQASSVENACNW